MVMDDINSESLSVCMRYCIRKVKYAPEDNNSTTNNNNKLSCNILPIIIIHDFIGWNASYGR